MTELGAADLRRRHLLLAAVLVVAAALRLLPLGLDSFWLDETTTARASSLAFGDMLVNRARAGHPPLFFVLTWLLARLPGPPEVLLRLPAALAGVGAVAVMYGLASAVADRRTALLAAALLAVLPQQVELSTLARAYELVALLGLASSWALVGRAVGGAASGGPDDGAVDTPGAGAAGAAWRDGPARLAAFSVLTALAVHVHYSALLVLAAQVAWLAARRRWRPAVAGLAGAASLLPWFLWSRGVGYAPGPNLVWIPPFSSRTVSLWLTTQLADPDQRWLRPQALAGFWLLVVLALGLATVGAVRARGRARLLVWLWLAPPALALASVAVGTNVLEKARYLATSSAVLAALLALGIGALRVTPRTRAGIAAACLGILASGSLAEIAEPVGTDWRGMARVLAVEQRPGEELIVLPDIPLRLLTLRYYYDGRWRQLGQPPEGGQRRAPARPGAQRLDRPLAARLRGRPRPRPGRRRRRPGRAAPPATALPGAPGASATLRQAAASVQERRRGAGGG